MSFENWNYLHPETFGISSHFSILLLVSSNLGDLLMETQRSLSYRTFEVPSEMNI